MIIPVSNHADVNQEEESFNPAVFFESKHAIGLLMLIAEHEGCTKLDIFQNYSEEPSVSAMLRKLEDKSLISSDMPSGGRMSFALTEKGELVYGHLRSISRIL